MTSNVDAIFARNGFDPTRVYTPQGDYGRLQCTAACTRQTWDTHPALERAMRSYDPATGEVTEPEAIPVCPNCGGTVFLNVHLDANYIGDPYVPTGEALQRWLNEDLDARILVLDIGSGYNTPGVIRWPMEQVTNAMPGARLVRISLEHPEVHPALQDRSVSFGGSVTDLISRV